METPEQVESSLAGKVWEGIDHPRFQCLAVAVVSIALIPITIVGVIQWRMVRQAESVAALKREVLEQGFERGRSALEIERLLLATEDSQVPDPARHAEIALALRRDLVQFGWSAEDIETVMQASAVGAAPPGHHSRATAEQVTREAAVIREWHQRGRKPKEIAQILRSSGKPPGRAVPLPAVPEARRSEIEAELRAILQRGATREEIEQALKAVAARP